MWRKMWESVLGCGGGVWKYGDVWEGGGNVEKSVGGFVGMWGRGDAKKGVGKCGERCGEMCGGVGRCGKVRWSVRRGVEP